MQFFLLLLLPVIFLVVFTIEKIGHTQMQDLFFRHLIEGMNKKKI